MGRTLHLELEDLDLRSGRYRLYDLGQVTSFSALVLLSVNGDHDSCLVEILQGSYKKALTSNAKCQCKGTLFYFSSMPSFPDILLDVQM